MSWYGLHDGPDAMRQHPDEDSKASYPNAAKARMPVWHHAVGTSWVANARRKATDTGRSISSRTEAVSYRPASP